ncbi:hypothetical protein SNEBB_005906 [Seison nebaliae]|nr:hypothetical protein SNEBB_005906 [Seison nebaliae]
MPAPETFHRLVWDDKPATLSTYINRFPQLVNEEDRFGRTPLHIAARLARMECARDLLNNGANAKTCDGFGWSCVQAAVMSKNREMIRLIHQWRDYQRMLSIENEFPKLVNHLEQAADYYVEMKMEFSSWLPFISKYCPNDCYKIYKKGRKVRIDWTLCGNENGVWQRGLNSIYVTVEENDILIKTVNHEKKQLTEHRIRMTTDQSSPDSRSTEKMEENEKENTENLFGKFAISDANILFRLTTPMTTTYLDTESIQFQRCKSGFYGWRVDRSEVVDDFDCEVYTANNCTIIHRSIMSHLSNERKEFWKKQHKNFAAQASTMFNSLGCTSEEKLELNKLKTNMNLENEDKMKLFDDEKYIQHIEKTTNNNGEEEEEKEEVEKPDKIDGLNQTEYFDALSKGKNGFTTKSLDQSSKSFSVRTNLWLYNDYPLKFEKHILPILHLLSHTNTYVKKLCDFIEEKLPHGFPLKIEVPLYKIIKIKFSFENVNSSRTAAQYVNYNKEKEVCEISDEVFEIDSSYVVKDSEMEHIENLFKAFNVQEDIEEELDFEEELHDDLGDNLYSEKLTLKEMLNDTNNLSLPKFQNEMQKAIEESLKLEPEFVQTITQVSNDVDTDLQEAIKLSLETHEKEKMKIESEEDETLKKILSLSLVDQ